ncbi:MAG: hypothetical protein ACOCVM_03655 [Desulfovibrionaceae bacterium]
MRAPSRTLALAGLLALALALAGCSVKHGDSFCADGVSGGRMEAVAQDAADRLAAEYPPGRTALHLAPARNGDFAAILENKLRSLGFRLEPADGGETLTLAYTLDALQAPPDAWYLSIRLSDGFSFTRIYTFGPDAGDSVSKGGVAQTPRRGDVE